MEASYLGYHTLVVKAGLKLGFYMFIASEIMLFFGFFWAFFHSSLCPAITIGSQWPPVGVSFIYPYHYPLYNTFLLIVSGFAITWAHKAFAMGNFREAMDAVL
jgi:cytochrome c oxidase subunit 3